jgi:small ligand-binding sensory domain FIST
MKTFAAALSVHPIAAFAVGSVIGDVLERIGAGPDLAVLFVTRHFAGALEDVVSAIHATLQPKHLVGLTVTGLIANGTEIEGGPAMMLWAGATGPCSVELVAPRSNNLDSPVLETTAQTTGLLLGDAASFAGVNWFERLPDTFVGGLVQAPPHEPTILIADRTLQHGGAVLVRFTDAVVRRNFVSVGTLGIGPVYKVTRSERSVLYELSGVSALDRLHEAVRGLEDSDRALAKSGVHLATAANALSEDVLLGPSDFVGNDSRWAVRRLLGMDKSQGALLVDGEVREGDLVQFRLRSRITATDELDRLVAGHFGSHRIASALCFVSTTRGKEFFGDEHHDATILHEATRVPIAGMFSDVEVAPYVGTTTRHSDSCTVLTFGHSGGPT